MAEHKVAVFVSGGEPLDAHGVTGMQQDAACCSSAFEDAIQIAQALVDKPDIRSRNNREDIDARVRLQGETCPLAHSRCGALI